MTQQTTSSTSHRHTGLVLFISDLHLCESRPEITQSFLHFLSVEATKAEALYVLGDLFEYWAGDDDITTPFHQTIIQGFSTLAGQGVQIFLMHGNRDFLMGEAFCQAANMTLLMDPTLIQLGKQPTLLSHGDALCTDDMAYQKMRLQFRDATWQKKFLSQPLSVRKAQIAAIRMESEHAKAQKTLAIMDVNAEAVNQLLTQFDYPPVFIHGHTHRPAAHSMTLKHHKITRYVLGDWYEQGSYLAFEGHEIWAKVLPA